MPADYGTLARAVSGFTDQLEIEANQARERKKQAEVVLRQLFPDLDDGEARVRLRQFDERAEVLAQTCSRLRSLLASVASSGSNPVA